MKADKTQVMRLSNRIILSLFILVSSCGTDETVCSVNSVTVFDKTFTRFTFSRNSTGAAILDLVKVNDGTDSSYTYSYTYSSGVLTNVMRTEDGAVINYVVTMDGNKVSKFASKTPAGKNQDETRLMYSGEQVTSSQSWLANEAGTLFQIGHTIYTYDSRGDLTKSETYIDLLALFSLVFGLDPSGYSPVVFGTAFYEPSNADNPMNGHFYLENLDMTFLLHVPQKITSKDVNGTIVSVDTYTIEQDGSGLPTKAISGAKYVEATYTCQ